MGSFAAMGNVYNIIGDAMAMMTVETEAMNWIAVSVPYSICFNLTPNVLHVDSGRE